MSIFYLFLYKTTLLCFSSDHTTCVRSFAQLITPRETRESNWCISISMAGSSLENTKEEKNNKILRVDMWIRDYTPFFGCVAWISHVKESLKNGRMMTLNQKMIDLMLRSVVFEHLLFFLLHLHQMKNVKMGP